MREIKVSQLRKAVARNLMKGGAIPRPSCEVSIDAIFLSAMAEIVYCKMPQMNIVWIDGKKDPITKKEAEPKIFLYDELNFGLAMESKNGLTVVTIKDVEHKNVWQLNAEIKELSIIAT